MMKLPHGMHYGRFPKPDLTSGREAKRRVQDKAVLWLGLVMLGVVLALGADVIWEFMEETGGMLFDFVEQSFETFFRKVIGLDLYHAQMATAYLDFILATPIAIWLLRKMVHLTQRARTMGVLWWTNLAVREREFVRAKLTWLRIWWEPLDWLNKTAVVVALLVIVIPLAALLSYGLGVAVAELL